MLFSELFVSIFATMVLVTLGCDDSSNWLHNTTLDSNNAVFIKWIYDKENITIEATVKTKGWLGIGFSPSGGMPGADIALAWVQNGKGYLQDRHGLPNDNGLPPLDKKQDVELLSSSENETHTTICFTRKLKTCDEEDLPITDDTMKVLWAFNPQDPTDSSKPETHGPKNRGQLSLNMLGKAYEKPSTEDLKFWDCKLNNKHIPGNESTYYWCQIFRVPNITDKQHLVGYEPLIQMENMDIVHHIAIHECTGENIEEQIKNSNALSQGFRCFAEASPPAAVHCQKGFVTWTVGQKGQFYPPNVGYPFGFYDGKPIYYMLDMHYNNANLQKGVDSSGIRLYYTNKLRQYDASGFLLGYTVHQPFQIIPPGQENWNSIALCAPECLNQTFTENKIQLFGVLLHAHLAVTRMVVRHFRGNIELPPIIENNHYQFNYQETVLFKDIEVLPNDLLTLECIHNTTTRKTITLGGQSTSDEMCTVMFLYYPRMNLSKCYSNLPLEDIENILGLQEMWPKKNNYAELLIKNPPQYRNITLRNYLHNLTLSETQINDLRNKELKGFKIPTCITDNGKFQSNRSSYIRFPVNYKPYVKNDICKQNKTQ